MIKITKDMVSFWLGSPSRKIIIKDLTDIANGDYPLKMLQQDIIDTWNINSEVEKIKFKNEIKGKIGSFKFDNEKVSQKLSIYKTGDKKFIEY